MQSFRMRILMLFWATLLAMNTACGVSDIVTESVAQAQVLGDSQGPADIPGHCPVTLNPDPPFVPPPPWPQEAPREDQFWFGSDGLWTALPRSGSWRQLALGEKFWWWSDEFDVKDDETPDLHTVARRLDAAAPPFERFEATNAGLDGGWVMLSGVELGSSGCWEFESEYQGHELSFVIWVPGA